MFLFGRSILKLGHNLESRYIAYAQRVALYHARSLAVKSALPFVLRCQYHNDTRTFLLHGLNYIN